MSGSVNSAPAKFKGFALVRDANGAPKFDDIFNIAPEFWSALTESEQAAIEQQRSELSPALVDPS